MVYGVIVAGVTAGVLEWADQRTPPEFRDEMRVEVDELAGALTVFECRSPWDGVGSDWSRARSEPPDLIGDRLRLEGWTSPGYLCGQEMNWVLVLRCALNRPRGFGREHHHRGW
jgi:hypothetical protein